MVWNFVHPLLLSVKLAFRNDPFAIFPIQERLLSGAARDFVCCPGGGLQSRLLPLLRASRTRPRHKRIALRVFGPPNFPKFVGRVLFQKIGSPEKVASNPISLARVVPRMCANTMRERQSPRLSALRRGQLLKARQAKTGLDS